MGHRRRRPRHRLARGPVHDLHRRRAHRPDARARRGRQRVRLGAAHRQDRHDRPRPTSPTLPTTGCRPPTSRSRPADAVSGVDRVEWQIDGGPWLHGPSGSFVHFTTTGEYQLRTRARDVAGNVSRAAARERHGRRDRAHQHDHAPAPGATSAARTRWPSPAPTPTPGVDGVEWQVDGGSINTGDPGDLAEVSGTGTHTLETRVRDAAGNWSGLAHRHDQRSTPRSATPFRPSTRPRPAPTRSGATAPVTVTVQAHRRRLRRRPRRVAPARPADPAVGQPGDRSRSTPRATTVFETRAPRRGQPLVGLAPAALQDRPLGPGRHDRHPGRLAAARTPSRSSATDAYSGVDEIEYTINGGARPVRQSRRAGRPSAATARTRS